MLSGPQVALLADLIVVSRRDCENPWDRAGVIAALRACDPAIPWHRIALAAIKVAADPRNETPAALNLDGKHWDRSYLRCKDHPESGTRGNGECAGCWADRAAPVRFKRSPHPPPPGIREQVAGSLRVKETETK